MAHSLPPEITVLLATHGRPQLISRALESVAAQTLPWHRFEVVVVVNGEPDGTAEVVRAVRARHPGLRLRTVRSSRPGVAQASSLGLWAARGEHLTILDDDDWVSPGYLAGLLAATGPGLVPLAWLAEVHEDAPGEPRFDNYYSRALARLAGDGSRDPTTTVPVQLLPQAISLNVGKLVPVSVARRIGYDESLRGGSDFVFWTRLFARDQFRFRLPSDRRAVYYRTTGHGSLSRQEVSRDFNVDQRVACVASLDSVATVSREVEAVTRRIVGAQLRQVRTYLDRHPEQRPSVTAELEERQLSRMDWSVVNPGRAEDLALLYSFPPWVDTSGVVAARRIRQRGVLVDLVCQNLHALRGRDPTSVRIAAPYLGRTHVVPGTATFAGWQSIASWSEGVFRRLEEWGTDYRSVYSRAMWAASHLVAAQYKIRHPQTRWTAEFSDPLFRTIAGQPRPGNMREGRIVAELRAALTGAGGRPPEQLLTFEWAELVAYALADEIVFTNHNQREYMLGYCSDPGLARRARAVSTVEPHPTLPPLFYRLARPVYALDPNRVHLAYFGLFYVTRGLTEVTDALAGLSASVRCRVHLHVFTKDPDQIRREVVAAGLADVVVLNPYLPFLEFLALTRRFDVLLVNDAHTGGHGTANPYLPSKLADYRGSGTPVWALVEPGSVLSTLDVEHRTLLGDVDGARSVLESLVRDRFGSAGGAAADWAGTSPRRTSGA